MPRDPTAVNDDDTRRVGGASRDLRRAVVAFGAAVLLALSLSAVVAGTAVAIDQVAVLSPDRTQIAAAPGETIEIDVILRSQGGHGGEGVKAVTLAAQYDPAYLEITAVDRGPWLEGDGTEIRTAETLAHDEGTAILEQHRHPAAGGTTGSGTIATLTVRVAADAPAGTTTISFDESDVALTGDWPIAVVDESATVAIDGGDEPLGSFNHSDPDDLTGGSAASGATNDSSAAGDETEDTDGGGGSAPVPGFTLAPALVAIAIVGLLFVVARDGRR